MNVHALLADGQITEIRPATPADFGAVKAMHEAMSPDNIYLRFFSISTLAAETEARRVCTEPPPGQVALLAVSDGTVIGVASYDIAAGTDHGKTGHEKTGHEKTAEVAFAVADHMHHKGIATLLLEHLVSIARTQQITALTAQTLAENWPMLHVFADAGLPVQRRTEQGVVEVRIPLPSDDTGTVLDAYLEKVARRERAADAASLRHVLAPESLVVIGASRRTGTVGRTIIDNIRTAGYRGRLYAVNPRAHQVGGVHCVPSVADLPEPPELAVIAVPAPAVLGVAEDCGKLGVQALVVITSGLEAAASADLLSACRRHGMRLVGPNCFGIAVPGLGLDATFAASHPKPGIAGLVMQSGGLGLAVVDQLSRLGIGVSSFVSVGSKLDVSGNDLLMYWEQDQITKLAVLYIESFGNPRKFARTARRVGASMPVLAVAPGTAGQQDGAPPLISREALFEQAGIIALPGLGELIETAAFLATQQVPAGRTVAIVSNVGGAGVLAADACTDLGLTVHHPPGLIRRKLRTLIPDTGAVTGPVDTTAAIGGDEFRQVVELIAADDTADAMIALVLPTGVTGDLVAAIEQADVHIPLAAVVLDQAESVRLLDERIPAYGYPEAAVAAVARAVRYGAWRSEPRGEVPSFPDVRTWDAHTLVRRYLDTHHDGGWLSPAETAGLLRCYSIGIGGPPGEVGVSVTDDQVFGPLVMLADRVTHEHRARFAPLTDADAETMIGSIRPAPLDPAALRELLLRVSRLADDLPEVTDLDLNAVIARPDGVLAVDARVKVMPHEPQDPFLRKLR